MYLQRKIDHYLLCWKQKENHNPIIVKGARQIGKTESILRFAKQQYEQVIYINFVEKPKYKGITAEGYDVQSIIKLISRIDPSVKFVTSNTVIIFDELQEFPEIATSLKFFKLDGRYDVICSGSLLGLNYQRIESNSVGYKEDYQMYSLDFEEFLWAKGYKQDLIDDIFSHMNEVVPVDELTHKLMQETMFDFCITGGMPAVVRNYIERGTFEGILEMQQQLHLDYREDITKYASGVDQARVLNVYNSIPVQLAKENKKFQITKVAKGAKFADYRGCVEWLMSAGLINVCYCMQMPELPLGGNYRDDVFKVYFADTGLLIAALDEESQEDLRGNKNMGIYKGALFENVVAEALAKSGSKLYYYKRENSTMELDFFMRTKDSLVPVEVKAGNSQAKSLGVMVRSRHYPDVQFGVKLVDGNVGYKDGIYTFPLYCAFLLKSWLKQK